MTTNRLSSALFEILEDQEINPISIKSKEIEVFIEDIQSLNKRLLDELKKAKLEQRGQIFEVAKNYQHWKLDTFKDVYCEKDKPFIPIDLESYRSKILGFLKSQPNHKRKEQNKARFYSIKDDRGWVKRLKFLKRQSYQVSILPNNFTNFIRKIFKKERRKIKYWKYTIPYRKLVSYQTEYSLTGRLNEAISIFSKASIANLKEVIETEQEINDHLLKLTLHSNDTEIQLQDLKMDLKYCISNQDNGLKILKKKIEEHVMDCSAKISELSGICGTLEYPEFYLIYQNRKRQKDVVFKKLRGQITGWGNTVFGLFEDWKVDQEIYNLSYFSKKKIDILSHEYHEHNRQIIELLEKNKIKISDYNGQIQANLDSSSKNKSLIIQKELDDLKQAISVDKFEKAIELCISFNLPERINTYESKINEFLKEIAEKRWLTKLTDYDKPLSSAELASFSPRELISFEYLPQLIASCAKLKIRTVRQTEDIQQGISNIEHVVAFNLSSIIESIEREDCALSDIPKLVEEGLDRAQNKLDELIEAINAIEKEVKDSLQQIVKEFIDSNSKLTVNENAFNLRLIVIKAKAIKRSEEVGIEFIRRAKSYYKLLNQKTSQFLQRAAATILPWKMRIGLELPSGIATELSDFLQEVYTKINNLPIIYQRLYKIMPLTEMSLFTGRKNEQETLIRAYENWKKGKYSPTAIIGEKWSGHTTLINFFLEKDVEKNSVLIEDRIINIKSKVEFFQLWQEIFNDPNIDSIDHLTTIIIKRYKGKIVVLENLQNYYLRTIHGFEALKMIIELITKTSKDVFWICSANIYSWKYLDKTIDLAGYFGYVIEMKPFSADELRELIMKKNNISGYKIIFTPSSKNLNSKKFQRLSDEEKQQYLLNQFFNDLNEFAKGNISLALTFWLLSTSNITEESIEITSFEPPDFSFINKLDADKVFIIYLLIMHDGLGFEHLSRIYKKAEDELKLLVIMMLDDGILIEKKERYEVNPLIYRHSINMLKSKNLIY